MCAWGEKNAFFFIQHFLKYLYSSKCINFDVQIYSDEWVLLCALHAGDTVINPWCWNCNYPLAPF